MRAFAHVLTIICPCLFTPSERDRETKIKMIDNDHLVYYIFLEDFMHISNGIKSL